MYLNLSGQNNSNDESIDGDSFAENDGDQILCLDPGSLDAAAHDGGAGGVDAEGGAHHGEGDGEADPDTGPHVGRGLAQEPAEVQPLSSPGEHIVQYCRRANINILCYFSFKSIMKIIPITRRMKPSKDVK